MNIIFSDNQLHLELAPLTLTRPVAAIRFGILTIAESWQHYLSPEKTGYITENYLSEKFKPIDEFDALVIAGNIKPDQKLADEIKKLIPGDELWVNDIWVARFGKKATNKKNIQLENLIHVTKPWHIFQKNDQAISVDYQLLTEGRKSQPIDTSCRAVKPENIFIEEGVKISNAILNASEGKIYLGKNSEVMDGAIIRGPFALGENASVKMGAKIYGATTIGPYCKVGGEITNSVFQSYSNKGHDGFLGNSVVGEWCNFGADTNSSNLMNTYGKLKIYSYATGKSEQTDVTFCGVLMGDHSKTGINTMLNTSTVVGVSANIFGAGFPAKYIPSFTWGAAEKSEIFKLDKAFEVATNMMERRNLSLSEIDKKILEHLFQLAR